MQPQGQPHQHGTTPPVVPDYNFIMNPDNHNKPKFSAGLGGGSMIQKVALAGGGLVVVIMLLILVASVFSGNKGYTAAFMAVAEDQQQIVHFVTTATANNTDSNSSLSAQNTNTATTLNLAIASSQTDILNYLKNAGYKVNTASLNLKVSTALDTQLAAAQAANTYDSTFDSLVTSQLQAYSQDLKTAYDKAPGIKGRELIKSDYDQAQLLLTQVSASN